MCVCSLIASYSCWWEAQHVAIKVIISRLHPSTRSHSSVSLHVGKPDDVRKIRGVRWEELGNEGRKWDGWEFYCQRSLVCSSSSNERASRWSYSQRKFRFKMSDLKAALITPMKIVMDDVRGEWEDAGKCRRCLTFLLSRFSEIMKSRLESGKISRKVEGLSVQNAIQFMTTAKIKTVNSRLNWDV